MNVLDHIVVSAATVEAGAAHIAASLGIAPGPGGQHDLMGTHNRLMGLGPETYLEAIAIDPAGNTPSQPRWFDLDARTGPPRLTNWVIRTDDLDTLVDRHPDLGRIHSLQRGDLRWRMVIPEDGRLPFDGCCPAALQWEGPMPHFPENGCRLQRLRLTHPDADGLAALIGDLIDDDRIEVQPGQPGLLATIETPDGPRDLG